MNEEVIKVLLRQCEMLSNNKTMKFIESYKELIKLFDNNSFSEENKMKVLIQLYRYGYYHNVTTSMDPRVDTLFKNDLLNKIKNLITIDNFDEELMNSIEEDINMLRNHIDNPVELIKKEISFYRENPGAKF